MVALSAWVGSHLSKQLINEYRAELDRLRQVFGRRRESVLREVKDLLMRLGKAHDLRFIAEHDILTKQMTHTSTPPCSKACGFRSATVRRRTRMTISRRSLRSSARATRGVSIISSDEVTAVLRQHGFIPALMTCE